MPDPPAMQWRGAALEARDIIADEWIISGPSETGKTVAALYRLDRIARDNPGAKLAMVRLVRSSMYATVVAIFKDLFVTDPETGQDRGLGVSPWGGEEPRWFDYSNGSRIWIAGMDDAGKILGGAMDAIYVNQAEQVSVDDWQTLTTRTTGRAGRVEHAMLFGDANPDQPGHWILSRSDSGPLKVMHSKHVDNPRLYTDDGELTDKGRDTMRRLNALTGVRRKRLLDGLWVQAEGTVYEDQYDETDETLVTMDADYDPARGSVLLGVDDGYAGSWGEDHYPTPGSHPRVFLLAQIDSTGTLNIFAEDYKLRTLPEDQLKDLEETCERYPGAWPPVLAAVDKSATTLKRRLHDLGIQTVNSPQSVDESIKLVRERMAKDENKIRLIRIHPRCRILRRELATYAIGPDGKPIKDHDHGPDGMRYLVWATRREL